MKKNVFLAALIAFVLSSCGCNKKVCMKTVDLTGTWNIVTAMDKETKNGDKPATITFDGNGQVNGNASVNSFFGGYTLKGNSISFGNMGMTRMMGKSMDIEQAINEALDNSATVETDGKNAKVMNKDGKTVMTVVKKE